MPVRKLDPEAFVHAYNVDLQSLYPWEGVVEPPFGAVWSVLAPGESTKAHAHQECESFIIARGRGVLALNDERIEVGPGDVSFHRPFDSHVLTNESDEDLVFLGVYWEDRSQWQEGEKTQEPRQVKRTLVTAAPPTPNGDLHLGHLAGPYLSADYLARYLRLRGIDARYASGSDDNCMWVVKAAGDSGTPEETARSFTDGIVEALELAGADLALFPRPNETPHHLDMVKEFFTTLYERGDLVVKDVPTAYCESCDQVLVEYQVRGRCPRCGEGVPGETCEACGWIHHGDVVDPECATCGRPAVFKPVRRPVFPMSRQAEGLRDWLRRVDMPTNLRSFCEAALTQGLPDVPVTKPGSWGIEVPVPGFEDQRLCAFFELAPRYLGYARQLSDEDGQGGGWERWWKSEDSRVVQFCGFDNAHSYGIYVPSLLLAFDPEIRLPDAMITNEHYHLAGSKFSTTRNHRILGRDLLAKVPRDAVRFYLAFTAPEREQTRFTLDEFQAACRRELLDGWEGWLQGLGRRVEELHDGELPATGDWTPEHRRFFRRLERLLLEGGEAYEPWSFSPQRATRVMTEIVREARRFGRGELHWDRSADTRSQERRTSLALQALAAKVLALVAAPVMPETAARIWRALGLDGGADQDRGPRPGDWEQALEWVPAGSDVSGLTGPLFPGLGPALDRLTEEAVAPGAARAPDPVAAAVTHSARLAPKE